MTYLEVILAVLFGGVLIQEVINGQKMKRLEMKMRGEKLEKATRR